VKPARDPRSNDEAPAMQLPHDLARELRALLAQLLVADFLAERRIAEERQPDDGDADTVERA
jgi:hypothetical protein